MDQDSDSSHLLSQDLGSSAVNSDIRCHSSNSEDVLPTKTKHNIGSGSETMDDERSVENFPNKLCAIHPELSGNDAPNSSKVAATSRVYSRRWYVLLLFALVSFTQCGIWYSWGPISDTSKFAFGWSNGTVALLWNWGQICFVIGSFAATWIIERRGLRYACLMCCFLVVLGSALRCITAEPDIATWLIQIGQILNGLGGAVTAASPLLSSVWFPPSQRTTATAFPIVLNSLGVGVSFLLGPYLVPALPDVIPSTINNTNTSNVYFHAFNGSTETDTLVRTGVCNSTDQQVKRHQIMNLMYVELAWSAALFVLLLIYFPNAPPTPPSLSASKPRESLKGGFLKLCRSKNFWLVCFTCSVGNGVYNAWQGIIDVALQPLGISQNEAGWIGFYSIVGSCTGTIILARFSDFFLRYIKIILIILFSSATLFLTLFVLQTEKMIPNSKPFLYTSILTGGLLLNAATPLLFEISCEITYPVNESTTNILLETVTCIVGILFVVLLLIPDIGTNWMNWCTIGSIPVCIPVICLIKVGYRRLNTDESSDTR